MTRGRLLLVGILGAAVLLAVLVAPYASSQPDGLERVAIDEGFSATARDHGLAGSPLADYEVDGIDAGTVSVAGFVGVVLTFAATAGVLHLVSRRRRAVPPTAIG